MSNSEKKPHKKKTVITESCDCVKEKSWIRTTIAALIVINLILAGVYLYNKSKSGSTPVFVSPSTSAPISNSEDLTCMVEPVK